MKHLVLTTVSEFENIISGKQFLVRFFKRRLDFINRLERGDLVYLRKKGGEVVGQFNAGKIVLIYPVENADYKILKNFSDDLSKDLFEEKIRENNILVIIQIEKLEQFITSPIDVPGNLRREWIVLEN